MFNAKLVTAGPRGNKCRGCETKVKSPNIILKVQGEFNKFSGFVKTDLFCSKCALGKLEIVLGRVKELMDAINNGPTETQIGSRKVRTI